MEAGRAGSSVFFHPQLRGFAAPELSDDLMHWDQAPAGELTAVETQFLGFNVPQANINAFAYMWAHPNLNVISGGVWAWQGTKTDALASELFDMRNFQSDDVLRRGGLSDYRMESGYHVEVLDPLERIRIRYEDESRDTFFDVTLTAIMPPAMVARGGHFDQAMRTEGQLRLRGRAHRVDGYHMRDRSWGETRVEVPRAVPPLYWVSPVFGDDFAIHVTASDDVRRDPIWGHAFDVDPEQLDALNRGWVWRDGELFDLVSVSVTTQWNRALAYPVSQTVDVVDSGGREHALVGTITAANNWHVWPNMRVGLCLARWECAGRTGWGETQAIAWNDFMYELMR